MGSYSVRIVGLIRRGNSYLSPHGHTEERPCEEARRGFSVESEHTSILISDSQLLDL